MSLVIHHTNATMDTNNNTTQRNRVKGMVIYRDRGIKLTIQADNIKTAIAYTK